MTLKIKVTRLAEGSNTSFKVIISSASLGNELTSFEFEASESSEEDEKNCVIDSVGTDDMIIVSIKTGTPNGEKVIKKVIPVWSGKANRAVYFTDPEVIINLDFTEKSKKVLSQRISERYDGLVSVLDDSAIPWYLRSLVLYDFFKNAIANIDIDYSNPYIGKLANVLKTFTSLLNSATKQMFTEEEGRKLMNHIDEVLMKYFKFFDETVESQKRNLVDALRNLKTAVAHHYDIFCKASDRTAVIVQDSVATTYVHASAKAQELLYFGMAKYPTLTNKICSTVNCLQAYVYSMNDNTKNYVTGIVEGVKTTTASSTQNLLTIAQPYVQQVVHVSQPYVAKAVEVSQPYVLKAMPYVEPVLQPVTATACHYRECLERNEYTGKYMECAINGVQVAYDSVVNYCFEEDPVVSDGNEIDFEPEMIPLNKKDVVG
jgi:hypothetical protein